MLTMPVGPSTTRTRTVWRGPTTIERIADRYAAIGVTTRLRAVGSRIGPPALNEYAVEPVGVADNHAVGGVAGHVRAVDRHVQPQHARLGAADDRRVVERRERSGAAALSPRARSVASSIIRGSMLQLSIGQRRQRLLEAIGLDLGQEADLAAS